MQFFQIFIIADHSSASDCIQGLPGLSSKNEKGFSYINKWQQISKNKNVNGHSHWFYLLMIQLRIPAVEDYISDDRIALLHANTF